MTEVQRLAQFVTSARYEDISWEAEKQLKIRILDSLGVAIAALRAKPIEMIRQNLEDFGGRSLCTLIGGGATAPDRAAFYNGALVRYLDFMDSYLTPGETFHPSDNLGAVLAASEYAQATGREFLTSLAIAYQVQAVLSEKAPVRAKGFDHTTQGAYAVAAGVSKALRLDSLKTANAIAISGTANNALRVTRTGELSHWKGLAYPNTAFSATHTTFLAMRGITGPLEVFEGNKGFKASIAGNFEIDWEKEKLDEVNRSIVKKYNAEIHAQSAIEGALELRESFGFRGDEIREIKVEIFQTAFDIIGGGEEGNKTRIHTKEEADHSLPYMIAVALLDGELLPKQYDPDRIASADVQDLLTKVTILPNPELTARFPKELPALVSIFMHDGRHFEIEKSDYEGFFSRPMPWDRIVEKFQTLTTPFAASEVRSALIEAVDKLSEIRVTELCRLLSNLQENKIYDR